MCYAKARLDELATLRRYLELGEDYRFFTKLFPPTEAKERGIEKILLSSELRRLLVQFAGMTSSKLLHRVCGYLFHFSREMEHQASALDSKYYGKTKRAVNLRKSAAKLYLLRHDMLEARQIPVSILPPSMKTPEVEAA